MINKKIKRILILLISIFLLFNFTNKVSANTVLYSNADGITTGWNQGDHSDEKVPAYIRGIFSISDTAANKAFHKTIKNKNYVVMYCKTTAANTCALNLTLLDEKTKDADGDTIYYADPNKDHAYREGLKKISEAAGDKLYFPVLQVGKKKGKEQIFLYSINYNSTDKQIKELLASKHSAKTRTNKYKKLWLDSNLFLSKPKAGDGSGTIETELQKAVKAAQDAEKKAQDLLSKKKNYELKVDESVIPSAKKGSKQKYTPKCSDVAIFTIIWKALCLLAPFLVMIFGGVGMFKAVIASDVNKMNEEKKKLLKRLIAFILLLLTPYILRVIVGAFGSNGAENTSYAKCIVNGTLE